MAVNSVVCVVSTASGCKSLMTPPPFFFPRPRLPSRSADSSRTSLCIMCVWEVHQNSSKGMSPPIVQLCSPVTPLQMSPDPFMMTKAEGRLSCTFYGIHEAVSSCLITCVKHWRCDDVVKRISSQPHIHSNQSDFRTAFIADIEH